MISSRLFKGFQQAGLTPVLAATQTAFYQQPARFFAKKNKKGSDGESELEFEAAAEEHVPEPTPAPPKQ